MRFSEIIGHDEAIRMLQKAIASGRISHSYLFSGPDGVGKETVARIFAKVLNCKEGGVDACERCTSCRKAEKGIHPDISTIRPDGNTIKIEEIREMQREVALKSLEGRWKVKILVDAEKMTKEASNCLLKTLEEPPPNSIIILVSSDPDRLLPTVISRCQAFRFGAMGEGELSKILMERFGLSEVEAEMLAVISSGRVGKAIGMIEEGGLVVKNRVIDALSSVTLGKAWIPAVAEMLSSDKGRLELVLDISFLWARDLWISSLGLGRIVNVDREEEIRGIGSELGREKVELLIGLLTRAKELINRNVNPQLVWETTLWEWKGVVEGWKGL